MRFLYTILTYLLISNSVFSQMNIFKKYDFEEEGYAIYLLNGSTSKQSDNLSNLFIDDAQKLLTIKNSWNLNKSENLYKCGNTHTLLLTYQGNTVLVGDINLDCKQIVINEEGYEFDRKLIDELEENAKSLESVLYKFNSIKDGRNFWNKIHSDSSILLKEYPQPKWVIYDGYFTIKLLDSDKIGRKELIDDFENKLEKQYPRNNFSLQIGRTSKSSDGVISYSIKVFAIKSFYEKLDRIDWELTYKSKWTCFNKIEFMAYRLI